MALAHAQHSGRPAPVLTGRTPSYVKYVLVRCEMLLKNGVTPLLVIDGEFQVLCTTKQLLLFFYNLLDGQCDMRRGGKEAN